MNEDDIDWDAIARAVADSATQLNKLAEVFNAMTEEINEERWLPSDVYPEWQLELLVKDYEVKQMRLPRKRKGKTPIDIGIVKQDDLTRVRISMGEDNSPGRKNSDLSEEEVVDLIAMLNYHLMVVRGEVTPDEQ